jgi:hypothetical protein
VRLKNSFYLVFLQLLEQVVENCGTNTNEIHNENERRINLENAC